MPQLVAVLLVGGAMWYGYKVFKREMTRVSRETREAEKSSQSPTALKEDKDGVYRPVDRDK